MIDLFIAVGFTLVIPISTLGFGLFAPLLLSPLVDSDRWEQLFWQFAFGLLVAGLLGWVSSSAGSLTQPLLLVVTAVSTLLGVISVATIFYPNSQSEPTNFNSLVIRRSGQLPKAEQRNFGLTGDRERSTGKQPVQKVSQSEHYRAPRFLRVDKPLGAFANRPRFRWRQLMTSDWQSAIGTGISLLIALITLFCAFVPSTDFQAVNGPLATVHSWANAEESFSRWRYLWPRPPGLAEGLLFWGHNLDTMIGPNLVQWVIGVFLAWSAARLARSMFGRPWQGVAACLVLGLPLVNSQMFTPLPELVLTLWCTLAIKAVRKAFEHRAPLWIWVSFLFATAASWTHPAGLLWTIIFGCTLAIFLLSKFSPFTSRKLGMASPFISLALLTAAAGWWFHGRTLTGHTTRFLSHAAPRFANVSDISEQASQHGGKDQQTLEPHYALLPCCADSRPDHVYIFVERLGLAAPTMGIAVLWYGMPPQALWFALPMGIYALSTLGLGFGWEGLMPLSPLIAMAVIYVWRKHRSKMSPVDQLVNAMAFGLVVAQLAWPLEFLWNHRQVAFGFHSRKDFLANQAPIWPIVEVLAIWPKEKLTVLSTAPGSSFLPGRVVPMLQTNEGNALTQLSKDADHRGNPLLKLGITHVVLAEPVKNSKSTSSNPVPEEVIPLSRRLSELSPILVYDRQHGCGHWWRYQLFLVDPTAR